jgi:hypothetical protein
MAMNGLHAPVPVWKGADYPRVPEGLYQAIAIRSQGPEWVRQFSRWSLLVEFELLDDGTRVCAFFGMGKDPKAPKVGRHSRFFKAWTLANGDPPRKGQKMSADVFQEGQTFTIAVKYSRRCSAGKDKTDAELYSVVTEIVKVEWQAANEYNPEPINQESLNQKSRIKQPPNQAVNQSGGPTRW